MPREGSFDFLSGGGETGARLRALNWTCTPLGAPANWSQSLKTIVRVMLDSRFAMWMLWGPEFTFFCNDAYLPTVGLKREWVLGARADKVWEEIWPDIGPRIAQVLEEGKATWDEGLLLFLERSGFSEETYHTFSYSPVYDDDGRIAGMLCVVTEVTERVIGERRLRSLRDLAARSSGIETVQQACNRLVTVLAENPFDVPFALLYVLDEPQGRAWLAATGGEVPERLRPRELHLDEAHSPWPMRQVSDSGQLQLVPLRDSIPSPPWSDRLSRAMVLPVQGQGSSSCVAVLIVGISPRRALDEGYRGFFELIAAQFAAAIAVAQAYETERQRAEALAEIDRAKTVFFSNVSHEFRTPLTLMLGPVEQAMSHPEVTAPVRHQLEVAHRNALRLLKLVNSLLDFSQIEAGRAQASYEPTDLSALTRDLASAFRSTIEQAGLRLEVECEELPEPVYVDPTMWEKVVLNLISNAFKFTLSGSISIRVTAAAGCAVLEVSDTGVGVPKDEIPRLFERFHRVEGTSGRTHEGSGIGLALVHEILKLHAASIEAESEIGRGTTFSVSVPFGSTHLPQERIKRSRGSLSATGYQGFVQEALRWLPNSVAPAPTATTTSDSTPGDAPARALNQRFTSTFGARIVLADDNADMRAYVHDLLAPFYSVEAVSDGLQALEAARRWRPDLILSDVMMPRLDGIGLLKALRSEDGLKDVPVILLSARAGESSRIEGLDGGADDYLIKPFAARELLARVGALIELIRIRAESEQRLRLALTSIQDQFYLLDEEFRYTLANRRVIELTRLAENELIGRSIFDVLPHVRGSLFESELLAVTQTRTPRRFELYYENWQSWFEHTLYPADQGVAVLVSDISERVEARQMLQTADRQKDEFLAMLAHELRNPLSPIFTATEVLARTASEKPHARAAISTIKRQATQLTRLVDDLLDVSRITQGRIELKLQTLELSRVVAQAVETVEPLLREKHHEVSITEGYQSVFVSGDFTRLVQCVVNVLINAAKYTDPRGRIRIETRADGTHAYIAVSDTGAGMSAELLPRIFDLFVQSERTLDRAQGGLGIGLSVVRKLLQMHGGEIRASSGGIGEGSSFEIKLPRVARPAVSGTDATPQKISPRRVFIVDDNADAADSLAELLRLEGHEAQAVHSPGEALRQIESFHPDIALLDIGLPEMDGFELSRRLRELPALAGVKFVALTGYGQLEDRRRVRESGFDDHLIKPVELGVLERILRATPAHRDRGASG
jgi:PAS domain S-box-containing protein